MALITVMLIIAIATFISVSMVSRQQINIHRSSNILAYEQSFQYLLAAESFAVKFLKEDWNEDKKNNKHDYIADPLTDKSELWSGFHRIYPAVPLGDVNISACIDDMQGRFNINNLATENTEYKNQFKRLLSVLDLKTELTDSLIDWFDDNSLPELYGAEDDVYFNQGYRTAQSPMQNLSELAFVKGFNEKIDKIVNNKKESIPVWEIVFPYLSDIPATNTTININTSDEELIESIEGIAENKVQNLVAGAPYDDVESAMTKHDLTLPATTASLPGHHGLSVESSYFQLNTFITPFIDPGNQISFQSVFYRDPGSGDVVLKRRSRGIVDPVNRNFSAKCLNKT